MIMVHAIKLRRLEFADLTNYRTLISPSRAFHRLNGPYMGMPTEADQNKKIMDFGFELTKPDPGFNFELIVDAKSDQLLGEVSFYWKDQRTNWLEIGIVIFDHNNWGRGIGRAALPLWIDKQLAQKPELVRIGLSTWSGNKAMMALAQKIGLRQEACFRKARLFEGHHYDSISYGILREEWQALRDKTEGH
ncbi:GNAT family protein [uncultured Cohaesibacter sp.]|uniref:GNAT family N-acetyltransferase n=1 Tax=uncultured Cohaesibacter sp. TaxID=1002546 RepID=UPI00292CD74C|nr:GNAT family protein [uncultured Cohaesibacter sp.]